MAADAAGDALMDAETQPSWVMVRMTKLKALRLRLCARTPCRTWRALSITALEERIRRDGRGARAEALRIHAASARCSPQSC